MYIFDGVPLDGYPELSPYGLADGQVKAVGAKRQLFADTVDADGSILQRISTQDNAIKTLPLEVYSRFTTAYTNLVTNPQPYSALTSWSAVGSVSSGPTLDLNTVKLGKSSASVTTNGSASTGLQISFTATAAAHSASVYVLAPSGAPMAVLFDGGSNVTFSGTGDWQQVKVENVTLTAATRKVQVIQTDTGSRTFYVNACCVTATTSATRYFDGAIGDAIWNGAAHASTSTSLVGEQGMAKAFGLLVAKTQKAESLAHSGGISLMFTPPGLTTTTTKDVISGDVSDLLEDVAHIRGMGHCTLTCVCKPYEYGPEYTVATGSKASGAPAVEVAIASGVKGDVICPARVVITNTSSNDQRFAAFGIQGRDYVSGTSLIIRADSMTTSGYSGTLTARTNEVQLLTKSGTLSGGTYTLALDGKTTTSLANTANAATIQAALEALPNIGTGNCAVSGGPISSGNVTFTFQGTLAGCNVAQLVINSSLTGGGTATMSTTTAGVPGYISSGLYADWTTICDTGNLGHIGSYEVWARVYDNAGTSDIYTSSVRLTWGTGDLASTTTNKAVTPQAVGDYSLVNLGQVHIPTAPEGTQRWIGQIQAKTSGTAGNTLRVVDVMLVPMETGKGEVRAFGAGAAHLIAFDQFNQSAGSLSGKSASVGGTYARSGDTDDFTLDTTNARIQRTATSDSAATGCFELLTVAHTDVDMSLNIGIASGGAGSPLFTLALRYVDASNYLLAGWAPTTFGSPTIGTATLIKCVGGVRTTLGSFAVAVASYGVTQLFRCTVSSAGLATLYWNGSQLLAISDSVLATGGALANGAKLGVYDEYTSATACTRYYDNLSASGTSPTTAVYNGRSLDFRDTGRAYREASGGGPYSPVAVTTIPFYPRLTETGANGNTNRLLLLTSRNNPDLAADSYSDQFDYTIYAKPVYPFGRYE